MGLGVNTGADFCVWVGCSGGKSLYLILSSIDGHTVVNTISV